MSNATAHLTEMPSLHAITQCHAKPGLWGVRYYHVPVFCEYVILRNISTAGKRAPSPVPLEEITFKKYLVNKPAREGRKRIYNPSEGTCNQQGEAYEDLVQDMSD